MRAAGEARTRAKRAARPPASLSINDTTAPESARSSGAGAVCGPSTSGVAPSRRRKSAQAMFKEVEAMAARYGLNRLVFVTLTFPSRVTNHRQAQARWRSLRAHCFAKRYREAVVVFERHESGGIHLHAVAVAAGDCRTGFDFDAFSAAKASPRGSGAFWRWVRKYGDSASPSLRSEWEFWRANASRYGFGRTEVAPVRVSAAAVARYLASYLTKAGNVRRPEDAGAKLVRFVGIGARSKTPRTSYSQGWSWATVGGRLRRLKIKWAAAGSGLRDIDHAREQLGPDWSRKLAEVGESIPDWAVPAADLPALREGRRKRAEYQRKVVLTRRGVSSSDAVAGPNAS